MRTMKSLRTLAACILLTVFTATGVAVAAEPDDSSLFVEAFNAYQKKDYLLAMDKAGQITQLFPESPLRDVTLLLLARAGFRSGDNELAAKTVNQFTTEFPDSNLKGSLEDELMNVGSRLKKGEKLAVNKQLRLAAQKVRNDQIALERAAALKAEQVRLAREKAERERIAREKAEAERRERERIAAEKAAREAIKVAFVLPAEARQVEAGAPDELPFELVNRGTGREEFIVSVAAPAEYGLKLAQADKPGMPLERVILAAGEKLKAIASFRMPANRVDGYKSLFQLKAVSTKFTDISFGADAPVIAAAPLVRAVAKPSKPQVAPGETFRYRITALNAGSIAAQGLEMQVTLPPQLELISAERGSFEQAAGNVFRLKHLDSGNLAELHLNVKVRDGVPAKQELRCRIDVINTKLQLKESCNSSPTVVQAK